MCECLCHEKKWGEVIGLVGDASTRGEARMDFNQSKEQAEQHELNEVRYLMTTSLVSDDAYDTYDRQFKST